MDILAFEVNGNLHLAERHPDVPEEEYIANHLTPLFGSGLQITKVKKTKLPKDRALRCGWSITPSGDIEVDLERAKVAAKKLKPNKSAEIDTADEAGLKAIMVDGQS